jgi:hypothetical protein
MAKVTIDHQVRVIESLKREVSTLQAEVAAMKAAQDQTKQEKP